MSSVMDLAELWSLETGSEVEALKIFGEKKEHVVEEQE